MKRQPPTNAFQVIWASIGLLSLTFSDQTIVKLNLQITPTTLEPPNRVLTNQMSQISQGTIHEDPEDEAVPENPSRKPLNIKINGHMREIVMPNSMGDNN